MSAAAASSLRLFAGQLSSHHAGRDRNGQHSRGIASWCWYIVSKLVFARRTIKVSSQNSDSQCLINLDLPFPAILTARTRLALIHHRVSVY